MPSATCFVPAPQLTGLLAFDEVMTVVRAKVPAATVPIPASQFEPMTAKYGQVLPLPTALENVRKPTSAPASA